VLLREPAWAEFRRGRPAPLPRATLANESLKRGAAGIDTGAGKKSDTRN
jgi:hypothetical protein